MVPVMVDIAGSLSTVTTSVSMLSDAQALPGWKIIRPAVAVGGGSIGNTSTQSYARSPNVVLEDAGSSVMVAAKPPATLASSGGGGGGYSLRKNSSSNSRSLVSDLGSNVQQVSPPPPPPPPSSLPPPPPPPPPPRQASPPAPIAALENGNGDDERPKLVTLSLLPDTPAQHQLANPVPEVVSSIDLLGRRDRDRYRDDSNRLELSLCSGSSASPAARRYGAAAQPRTAAVHEQRVPQQQQQEQSRQDAFHPQNHHQQHRAGMVIDSSYLEQAYGGSSDPVALTEDLGGGASSTRSVVLWSNLSYDKVVSERLGGKPQRAAGPYIDPLGLPTQLGCFRYRMRDSECNAVLWGFLKKFMHTGLPSSSSSKPGGRAEFVEQSSSSIPQQHQHQHQQQRVIAPQPVRPVPLVVGSNVCLDSITEVNSYAGYLSGSLETVESQLEKDGLPAFVTDRSNRVRWVNAAYNQLVRSSSGGSSIGLQDSASSNSMNAAATTGAIATTVQPEVVVVAAASTPTPDVCVTFQSERSPYSAVSLVGQARVDWMEGVKRCYLSGVPCEMRRLDDQHLGSLFVWKLNLNVGSGGTARYAAAAAAATATTAAAGGNHSSNVQVYGHECYGVRERGFV
ncbi:hypothetical protein SELMODRAFT_437663 [Selaginella moellendorffii]|uniref:DUF7950 domain-containing protein n=1 Tax=Selaginella moellendorffii TaxID=88036 RepID=D8QNP5_SELML|nr:hypothetical protein SELMODRAFT_437663 [Selaginella moellendorffii]